MANNLEVRITADVADLQAKLALAQQNLREATARMQADAKAISAGGGSAGTLRENASAVAEYNAELGSLRGQLVQATASTESFRFGTAGAARELIVLGHEAATGNFSRMPGTLMVLAARAGGLHTALAALATPMGAAAAGAAAFTGALVYLEIESLKAEQELGRLRQAFTLSGQVDITRGQIEGFASYLRQFGDLTAGQANKIVGSFGSIPDAPARLTQALVQSLPSVSAALGKVGDDAVKLAEEITKSFQDTTGGSVKFAESFKASSGVITADLLAYARQADKSGNANEVFSAKTRALVAILNDQKAAVEASIRAHPAFMSSVELGPRSSWDPGQTSALQRAADLQVQAYERSAAGAAHIAEELSRGVLTSDQLAIAADKLAGEYNTSAAEAAKLKEQLALAQQAQGAAAPGSDRAKAIQETIDEIQAKLAKIDLQPLNDAVRASIVQLGQTQKEGTAEYIAAELAKWNQAIATARAKGEENVEAEREVERLKAQLHQTGIADAKRAALEQAAAAREAAAAMKQAAQEQIAAEKQAAAQAAADAKAAAATRQAIALEQTKTAITVARIGVEEEKSELQAGVINQGISAAQKAEIMHRLETQLAQYDIAALTAEQANLTKGTLAWQQNADQIALIRARLGATLAGIDAQVSADNKRTADLEANDWKALAGSINTALDGMLSGVLQGTQTAQEAMQHAAGNILITWIEALAKMLFQLTAFELASAAGFGKLKDAIGNPLAAGSGVGGLIGSALGIGGKTAGAAGNLAQTGAITANTAALTALTGVLGGHAAIVGANTLGTAVNTVSTDASTLSQDVLGLATDASQIATVVEAAGTDANTVALAANTAALGAGSGGGILGDLANFIPFFDVGAWDVPHDTLAMVHRGEMVSRPMAEIARETAGQGYAVPDVFRGSWTQDVQIGSPLNTGSRDDRAGQGIGPAGDMHVHFTIHAFDGPSVEAMLSRKGSYIAETVAEHWRLNLSTRPNF